jgi:hypothetical protein
LITALTLQAKSEENCFSAEAKSIKLLSISAEIYDSNIANRFEREKKSLNFFISVKLISDRSLMI